MPLYRVREGKEWNMQKVASVSLNCNICCPLLSDSIPQKPVLQEVHRNLALSLKFLLIKMEEYKPEESNS